MLILTILLIWFVSCKHWWKYAILAPIWMTLFQLFHFLNDEFLWFKGVDYITTFFWLAPIMAFLVWVAKKPVYSGIGNVELLRPDSQIYLPGRVMENIEEVKDLRQKKMEHTLYDYLVGLSFQRKKLNFISISEDEAKLDVSNFLKYFKKSSLKRNASDIIVFLMILALPFIFYLYKLAPITPRWKIWFLTLSSEPYFSNIQYFLWLLSSKFLLVSVCLIWYLSCRYWWKYAILAPLTLGILQLISLLNVSVGYFDEIEYKYSLPIVIPIVIVLIWLSRKLHYMAIIRDLQSSLDAEIKHITRKIAEHKNKIELKKKLTNLKKGKKTLGKKDYLMSLIAYRNELQDKLDTIK